MCVFSGLRIGISSEFVYFALVYSSGNISGIGRNKGEVNFNNRVATRKVGYNTLNNSIFSDTGNIKAITIIVGTFTSIILYNITRGISNN